MGRLIHGAQHDLAVSGTHDLLRESTANGSAGMASWRSTGLGALGSRTWWPGFCEAAG